MKEKIRKEKQETLRNEKQQLQLISFSNNIRKNVLINFSSQLFHKIQQN
jgi:hypothetical protein